MREQVDPRAILARALQGANRQQERRTLTAEQMKAVNEASEKFLKRRAEIEAAANEEIERAAVELRRAVAPIEAEHGEGFKFNPTTGDVARSILSDEVKVSER